MVLVANFSYYDVNADQTSWPDFKRLLTMLESTQELTKTDGTEEDVPESALDDDGRYFPPAPLHA